MKLTLFAMLLALATTSCLTKQPVHSHPQPPRPHLPAKANNGPALRLKVSSPGPPLTTVTLSWDQVDTAGGYNVYTGSQPGTYTNKLNVVGQATTTATISNLLTGTTYYFVVTATNGPVESAYSNEVNDTAPAQYAIQVAAVIQESPFLGPTAIWTNIAVCPVLVLTNDNLPRFFRANMVITTDGRSWPSVYPNSVIGVGTVK